MGEMSITTSIIYTWPRLVAEVHNTHRHLKRREYLGRNSGLQEN